MYSVHPRKRRLLWRYWRQKVMVALSGEPMSLLDFDQRISRTQGRLVIASCLRVLETSGWISHRTRVYRVRSTKYGEIWTVMCLCFSIILRRPSMFRLRYEESRVTLSAILYLHRICEIAHWPCIHQGRDLFRSGNSPYLPLLQVPSREFIPKSHSKYGVLLNLEPNNWTRRYVRHRSWTDRSSSDKSSSIHTTTGALSCQPDTTQPDSWKVLKDWFLLCDIHIKPWLPQPSPHFSRVRKWGVWSDGSTHGDGCGRLPNDLHVY